MVDLAGRDLDHRDRSSDRLANCDPSGEGACVRVERVRACARACPVSHADLSRAIDPYDYRYYGVHWSKITASQVQEACVRRARAVRVRACATTHAGGPDVDRPIQIWPIL
jgi:hypothetical protein